MFKGFKEFLMRGNVIDLAVAVVMGTAFTAVVTAVTKGVVNPLLAIFGSTHELGLGVQLISSKPATFIAVGPIITAVVDFVMVAAVLYFVLMLPMKTIKNRFGTPKAAEPTDIELLTEIRDLLAERHEAVRAQRSADREVEQAAKEDAKVR
ncbi:large conductance mechanosensitive channel protein MscL [Nocardia gipuzkoensis]|uniref:large conductance mechanosensitive channel protein MscL n=1 Tax=Nocardia TaxID=1817 RepID=UPI00189589C5|nr:MULTISPECIES: large conductance mechanosensitive channel protein MscL [Nocardia]MBF6218719.1 large conductance mechanosensitive channel protein MscL [Nocardia abscessus]MBF6473158.1 large conductance mechanosensitive channel protein MscL [Nocardia abscessus]MDE1672262.1 large conductance mechanosensitive channel protein MscL [Nocardia gipuzkoensis]